MKNYNIVSISGGKDSVATLLLAMERKVENIQAVFADTGHEHPEVYRYISYLEEATGMPIQVVKADFADQIKHKREVVTTKWRNEGVSEKIIESALSVLQPTGVPFLDLCLWKGRFPSTKARFCTQELKVFPIQNQVFAPLLEDCYTGDIYSWQGIRADESQARARLPVKDEADNTVINYRPILNWSAQQVFDFHKKHNIKPNPLYKKGMSRVGCMPCVNCNKSELREIALRFPEELDRVAEWESLVSRASKLGCSTFLPSIKDPTVKSTDKIHHQTHGIYRLSEWAKTERGGRHYSIIASANDARECSSVYGLCD